MTTSTSKPGKTKTRTITEPITDLTSSEVLESLTGFDEIAIKERFKAPIGELFAEAISTARRALVFVVYKRQENGPKDPYKAAMSLTVGDLDAAFAQGDDDEDDAVAGEALSELGKDE